MCPGAFFIQRLTGAGCRDVSQLDIVPGSQVTSQSVSGVVTLQSTQLYNVLLSGPEDGPDIGYSAVQLGYTIYPPGAPGEP